MKRLHCKLFSILLTCILFTFLLPSLNAQNFITIKGRVSDKTTGLPLRYATVNIKNSNTGVITNEFGEFTYNIPDFNLSDSIQISYIGYQRKSLAISELAPGVIHDFEMAPAIRSLTEIKISGKKGIPAADIVEKAIKSITKNYPKKKFLLHSFYRDYIREQRSNDYKNLTEAAIVIQDRGFNTVDYLHSRIKLEQIRYNPDFNTDTVLNFGYDNSTKFVPNTFYSESNELAILRLHNPIRNYKEESFSFVDIFKNDFVKNHRFNYESIIDCDSFKILEISFDTYKMLNEPSKSEYWANGKIYIHSNNYAILKFSYALDCKLTSYSGKLFDLNLEYKKYEDKYYLNYLSFCNYFQFKSFAPSVVANSVKQYFQYRELFVNKVETDSVSNIKYNEAIQKDEPLLSDKVPEQAGFWRNYNYTTNLPFLSGNTQKLPAKFLTNLEKSKSHIPLDKLYLHTDRNIYYPGDTVYFQTYFEDRFTQKLETSSRSSYVLLVGSENEVIDSARFRINYAMAPGWLAVPNDCKSGWYQLKAFTSQMQNYDPAYVFSSWIRIDELIKQNPVFNYRFNKDNYLPEDTVEINFEVKEQNGEPLKNTAFTYTIREGDDTESTFSAKTTRKGTSLIRLFMPASDKAQNVSLDIALEKNLGEFHVEIPLTEPEPDIRFLSEGGTFISGVRQKVAFNGVSHSGRQLFLSGVIKDDLGTFIDSVHSGNLGPGVIQFTPERGRKYFAEFSDYPGQNWPLPETENGVPCISVSRKDKGIIVDVSAENNRKQYFLAFSKNDNLVAFTPLTTESTKRIVFKTDSLPPGMAKVTLFKEDLQPLAERVLFIPPENEPFFSISTGSKVYQPAQQTSLNVEIKQRKNGKAGSGFFSVAVVDSATALSPQIAMQNIRDRFWFDEEFYSRLPFHIKKVELGSLPEDDLDLLLLTYGWTKLKNQSSEKIQKKAEQYYDQYAIEIAQLRSSRKRKKLANTLDPLFVVSLEEPGLIGLTKKNDNSYLLDIDSIPWFNQSIIIAPNFAVNKQISAATLKPVINHGYFDSVKDYGKSKELYLPTHSSLISEPVINLDSFRVLKEIDVYARKTPAKKYVNEYEKKYQGAQTHTLSQVQIETAMKFTDLLVRLHPFKLDLSSQQIYFGGPNSIKGDPPPALFVLDGTPVGTEYSSLMTLNPSHIHSITHLKSKSGYYIYGEEARGGIIFVETIINHIGDEYELPSKPTTYNGDLRKILQLFRSEKEFYTPPQEAVSNDPALWIRPTIYWNSEVFYDGESPVNIEYFNPKKSGSVFVILNGITMDGIPVCGIHKYLIN